jgi:hypothetical protein
MHVEGYGDFKKLTSNHLMMACMFMNVIIYNGYHDFLVRACCVLNLKMRSESASPVKLGLQLRPTMKIFSRMLLLLKSTQTGVMSPYKHLPGLVTRELATGSLNL